MHSALTSRPLPPNRLRQHVRRLKRSAVRSESGEIVLEGVRLLRDSVGLADIAFAIADADRIDAFADLVMLLETRRVPVYAVQGRDFDMMTDTEHSQGILAVARWRPVDALGVLHAHPDPRCITVLSRTADPGNLGTIIRSCEWFGFPHVLLSEGSVDPANPKVVRASMGALFSVSVGVFEALSAVLGEARRSGYRIVGTSANEGTDLSASDASARSLVVFGSEAHGLPDIPGGCDDVIRIPRAGVSESLNLAVAHGIILSHMAAPSR